MQEHTHPGVSDADVRHIIYQTFAQSAHPPTTRQIAEKLNISIAEAEHALDRLAKAHHIALAPGTHTVWMAHPFSGLPTSYITRIGPKVYWGN